MTDTMIETPPVFGFSEAQLDLRAAVRRFLEVESPVEKVFADIESDLGYDPAVWRTLADQIGLPSILLPEQYGGSGGGQVDLAVALEETGAALLCAPYFSTIALATNALLVAGDEQACADYLPGIAEGRTLATLATDPARATAPMHSAASAEPDGAGWRVSGTGLAAIDGLAADLILLVAVGPDDTTTLFAVDAAADGVRRTPLETLDLTRRQARIDLDRAPARQVGDVGAGLSIQSRVLDLAATATAAEQVGGADRCLHDAVAYTKQRIQFGRRIASFQAVKHLCADLLIELELARTAAQHAAWIAQHAPDDLPRAAAMARMWCSRTYEHIAEESLQLYGGIGATWEHRSHLYLRRAKASTLLLSGVAHHRAVLAREIEEAR